LAPSLDSGQATAPASPEGEARESFEHLTRLIAASIERLEADVRTRMQLRTLWDYLWRQQDEETHPPSYRQLAQRLNIPRERLPLLFSFLRKIVPR
jgi:hypothetical protein